MKQREIKFRAWDKVELYMTKVESFPDMMSKEPIPNSQIKNMLIMQYTGLKDKNGKEIYEGDAVRFKALAYGGRLFDSVVKFNPIIAAFMFDMGDDNSFLNNAEICEVEVIGNIYENPDLIAPATP